MATAPQLESELATVGHREVILDLRQLEFMDSTGLHTILSLHHSLRDNGRQLKLIKGPLQIQRIFDLTGFTSRLEFLPG
jgi:anti-sigma B factor antagonist